MGLVQGAAVVEGAAAPNGISLPKPVWLILFALAIGIAQGLDARTLIQTFSTGFGSALGSFALILIPSFVLAACFASQPLNGAPKVASAIAPVTAAGMVCPDTAYVALSTVAKNRKLSVAFGCFAGYRLLFPAGPLIVATGLGTDGSGLLVLGFALLIPVWLAGEVWARFRTQVSTHPIESAGDILTEHIWRLLRALLPLLMLAALLVLGGVFELSGSPPIDFVTRPKGALLAAAAFAVWMAEPSRRRESLDSAMKRSGSLLLLIGAASAFGLMLTKALPVENLLPTGRGGAGLIIALFFISLVFKIAYGSSTVALATVTSVLATVLVPMIESGVLSHAAAVFAICLGSLAIIPTDSFYWLVRSDALAEAGERNAIITLGGGAALQAIVGLLALIAGVGLNII